MRSRYVIITGTAAMLAACTEPTAPSRANDAVSPAVAAAGRPNSCPSVPKGTSSITLSPATATIEQGATQLLVVKNQSGVDIAACAVTWAVSPDASVATVSSAGLVTGVSLGGPVTISASVNGKGKSVLSASSNVTVVQAAVASVILLPTTSNLTIGATQPLTAELRDARGTVLTGRTVSWSSDAPSVATVSSSGLVTGVFLGQATVTATSEGVSGTADVTVNPVALSSLSIVAAWWEGGASRIYSMRGDGTNQVYREVGISPSRVGNLMVARGGNFGENVIYAMDSTGGGKHQYSWSRSVVYPGALTRWLAAHAHVR